MLSFTSRSSIPLVFPLQFSLSLFPSTAFHRSSRPQSHPVIRFFHHLLHTATNNTVFRHRSFLSFLSFLSFSFPLSTSYYVFFFFSFFFNQGNVFCPSFRVQCEREREKRGRREKALATAHRKMPSSLSRRSLPPSLPLFFREPFQQILRYYLRDGVAYPAPSIVVYSSTRKGRRDVFSIFTVKSASTNAFFPFFFLLFTYSSCVSSRSHDYFLVR